MLSDPVYLSNMAGQFRDHFDSEVAAAWSTWWTNLLLPGTDDPSFHGFDGIQFGSPEWLNVTVEGNEALAAFNMTLSYHTVLEDGSIGWTAPVRNQFQLRFAGIPRARGGT